MNRKTVYLAGIMAAAFAFTSCGESIKTVLPALFILAGITVLWFILAIFAFHKYDENETEISIRYEQCA